MNQGSGSAKEVAHLLQITLDHVQRQHTLQLLLRVRSRGLAGLVKHGRKLLLHLRRQQLPGMAHSKLVKEE